MSETTTQAPIEPEQVLIFDTTLRDGAQSPGIALSGEESLMIAHQLNRLGVDVIEAGFPVSSPANFAAVQAIAREIEGPIIAGLARVNLPDIESAAQAVKDSDRPRIHTFVSTSDIHIEHQMGTSRPDVIGLARAGVASAKSHVDDVEFSPMDATRSDAEFTAEVIQIAIDEGATTINIPDTVGYTEPDEFRRFLGKLYDYVPALGGVVLSVHCHDDLGLAVANSFAGIKAGARQVECAVNGLGERAGNAALEEIVMLLKTRRLIDGYDTRINTELLGPTSRMVSRYTSYPVPNNKAIVGGNAFQHESGIHQAGILNSRNTFEIMDPAQVGMNVKGIVLGKQSGRNALEHVLKEEGVFKPKFFHFTFYNLFKDLADEIGGITSEQAVALHEEAARRQTATYNLEGLELTSTDRQHVAFVEINRGAGSVEFAEEASDTSNDQIDGSISAIFQAIKQATGTSYPLKDYSTKSIGEGEKTIGEATVEIVVGQQTIIGRGLSRDVLKAAAWAYLNALSKAETEV